jgi:hypothetical protein
VGVVFRTSKAPLSGTGIKWRLQEHQATYSRNPKEGFGRRKTGENEDSIMTWGIIGKWCEVESAIVIPPHGLRQAFGAITWYR